MNIHKLIDSLKRHEGLRLKPYPDTVGKLTIGYGRNLTDVGISESEAEILLQNDIHAAQLAAGSLQIYPYLDEVRQRVLVEMVFNLGLRGVLTFKRMFAALDKGDFVAASVEMIDSNWADQVGLRAMRLAQMMRTGED